MDRIEVGFDSAGTTCAAWHYPGTSAGCVVMAGGFGVPKEPATDRFAQRFQQAGFHVLAFDYRHIGASGGEPRQVLSVKGQLADWDAALAHAASLPGVERLAAWGFSASGGHIFRVAQRHPELAAAIAQTPNADGLASSRSAAHYTTPWAMARLTGRGVLDAIGGLVGRPPRLVPLVGERGSVAVLSTPDVVDGDEALDRAAHPDWVQAVAARSVLPLASYRPGRVAADITCPLLVLVCEDDRTALVEPSVRAAEAAPRGQLVRLSGGHYAPFLAEHEKAVAAQLAFLDATVRESTPNAVR